MVKLIEGQKYYVIHKLKENDLVTRLAIMPKVIVTSVVCMTTCMYVCMYVCVLGGSQCHHVLSEVGGAMYQPRCMYKGEWAEKH